MKIIDGHMHFFRYEGFNQVAKAAGHENTVENYLEACRENNVVLSVAMGNAPLGPSRFGGVVPRVPDLAGPCTLDPYNQPAEIAFCAGLESNALTKENCEKTAQEFEPVVRNPHCVGIKIYTGYNQVYAYDPRHFPLYELAEAYQVPVVFHTGDTAGGHGLLKYAHPLTIDEVAGQFPRVKFVIAHCGNPWILDAMEVVAKNPNVYVDLSGLLEGKFDGAIFYEKHRDYFRYIRMWLDYVDRYDKVIYGTDWPLINIHSYIDNMKLVVPEAHHEEFFYRNALRVYTKLLGLLPKEENA